MADAIANIARDQDNFREVYEINQVSLTDQIARMDSMEGQRAGQAAFARHALSERLEQLAELGRRRAVEAEGRHREVVELFAELHGRLDFDLRSGGSTRGSSVESASFTSGGRGRPMQSVPPRVATRPPRAQSLPPAAAGTAVMLSSLRGIGGLTFNQQGIDGSVVVYGDAPLARPEEPGWHVATIVTATAVCLTAVYIF